MTNPNQTIEYGFCPPTSGDHYNVAGRGPIQSAVYPPGQQQAPGAWVHNLEHGWVAVLYRCPGGRAGAEGCPSEADMQQLQAFLGQAPLKNNCGPQVLAARFDEMSAPFAMVVWGRVLLMDEFNLDTALTFAQQWMDHEAVPEAVC